MSADSLMPTAFTHSHSHKLKTLTVLCLTSVAHCVLGSLSADSLMSARVTHSHPPRSKTLTTLCATATTRCPLESLSARSLMPAEVTHSHSPKTQNTYGSLFNWCRSLSVTVTVCTQPDANCSHSPKPKTLKVLCPKAAARCPLQSL
jgi:hypothetical protein